MACFHPCEQLKQPWTLKPLIAEVWDRGPNSKRTLLQQPLLEGWWGIRVTKKEGRARILSFKPHPPATGLFVSISWVAATKRGFFSLSLPPSLLVYLFDFTPCRPKWPLPCVQNYFIPFCSEADSHREPWKGPLEGPWCVFSWAFTGSVSIGFSTFCCCSRCGNQFGL